MAPTPPEEIARQHQAACRLCEEQNPDVGLTESQQWPDHSEIGLDHKKCSIVTHHTDRNDTSSAPQLAVWSSRGNVDVSALQELIQEGYELDHPAPTPSESKASNTTSSSLRSSTENRTNASETNFWDPANASVNNVAIVRPSHDAWGIGKIVLIFCDDFLQNVYELPYLAQFRQALGPILEQLNIRETQVVRCLLANLPPGVTIPVHYDTGAWVHQTHRIHVPVLVEHPEQVYFACGLANDKTSNNDSSSSKHDSKEENPATDNDTDSGMQRIACTPGHMFEINNQVWHTVSNCSPKHRVHLILDYMDQDVTPERRVRLDPGEKLLQTRRSVDRLSSQPRPVPAFVILGAQKAGTTSLYHYITQHPLIVPAKRRETHCLDWRWNDEAKTTKERQEWVHNFYHYRELKKYASCCTGDSTPSYLLDARRVIPRLKEVFPHQPALLVTCREPLARCWSHYQMVTSTKGTKAQLAVRGNEWRNKPIHTIVRQEIDDMNRCGLIPYMDLETGACNAQHFFEFCDSPAEDAAYDLYLSKHVPLNTGSHNLLVRSLYALQLRPWLKQFGREKILILPLESFHEQVLPATMEAVYRHLDLPSSVPVMDGEPKNVREYQSGMPGDLQAYLQHLFSLHTARLKALVGDCPHWKDVAWCDSASSVVPTLSKS